MLTTNTKIRLYQACVLSTLLHSSESRDPACRQKRRLNTFHLRNARRIWGITWQDRILNKDVLAQAAIPSMFALVPQRCLCWLAPCQPHAERTDFQGHVILYSELASGSRPAGRPLHCYKNVCKKDMKAGNSDPSRLGSRSFQPWQMEACRQGKRQDGRGKGEDRWEGKRAQTADDSFGFRSEQARSSPAANEAKPVSLPY